MKITEALKSLDNAWSREDILVKIQKGEDSEKILNDFFYTKEEEIKALTSFINPEDSDLLSEIEELSNIESKLIKKIKNHSLYNKQLSNFDKKDQKTDLQLSKNTSFNFGLFMMKWSNKFVFISLLVISAIALTKQAWA